jgi:hypothetical protein
VRGTYFLSAAVSRFGVAIYSCFEERSVIGGASFRFD